MIMCDILRLEISEISRSAITEKLYCHLNKVTTGYMATLTLTAPLIAEWGIPAQLHLLPTYMEKGKTLKR